jgi:hypothetical protein
LRAIERTVREERHTAAHVSARPVMMRGKLTRTLKLRAGATEVRNLTIRNVPSSEF